VIVGGPREKLVQSSVTRLSDVELWMLVLGRGSRSHSLEKLARSIMETLDSNPNPDLKQLTALQGIHTVRAGMIQAILEIGKRRFSCKGSAIGGPEDAFQMIRNLGDRKQEHFLCMTINGAGELIQVHTVTIGLVNRTLIHPREVFAPALKDRAASIIVAHNHPSRNLEPSQEDREITRRLQDAGDLLGIPLLDHIVFHFSDYRSIM
tara:strand:+ start:31441 stop:32061 length:621 start_codon:yes stop_codon:yes gene_type:complete